MLSQCVSFELSKTKKKLFLNLRNFWKFLLYPILSPHPFKYNKMNIIHQSRMHNRMFIPSTKSSKTFTKGNINMVMKRNYETILKPAGPPSAHTYQISKLQALNGAKGGLFSKLTRLNLLSAKHPLMLATGIATLKSAVCDWIAQTGIEGRDWDTFNWSRFTLFALFGLLIIYFYNLYNCFFYEDSFTLK